jgi:hypothetical protein
LAVWLNETFPDFRSLCLSTNWTTTSYMYALSLPMISSLESPLLQLARSPTSGFHHHLKVHHYHIVTLAFCRAQKESWKQTTASGPTSQKRGVADHHFPQTVCIIINYFLGSGNSIAQLTDFLFRNHIAVWFSFVGEARSLTCSMYIMVALLRAGDWKMQG